MAGEQRWIELPVDVIDKIQGFMRIEDAAKTAVLSSGWRDSWFGLTRLNFDHDFFRYMDDKAAKCSSNTLVSGSAGLYVVNKVLAQHKGPINKFALDCPMHSALSHLFDFDQWLLLLSRKGVQEIHFALKRDLFVHPNYYKLADCILHCRTLKKLHLCAVKIDLSKAVLAPPPAFIFPSLTSLHLERVYFSPGVMMASDHSLEIPVLENLSVCNCDNMAFFAITAPKLLCFKKLDDDGGRCDGRHGSLPRFLDLRSLPTLQLDASSLKCFVKHCILWGRVNPIEPNVDHLIISVDYCEVLKEDFAYAFTRFLQICPTLSKLDLSFQCNAEEYIHETLKKYKNAAQTHKKLNALKIGFFNKPSSELCFIKWLPGCFPSLEKVAFETSFDPTKSIEIVYL